VEDFQGVQIGGGSHTARPASISTVTLELHSRMSYASSVARRTEPANCFHQRNSKGLVGLRRRWRAVLLGRSFLCANLFACLDFGAAFARLPPQVAVSGPEVFQNSAVRRCGYVDHVVQGGLNRRLCRGLRYP